MIEDKTIETVEKSIEKINKDGLNTTNLDHLYKLMKIRHLAKEDKEMNYGEYGRGRRVGYDSYGRDEYGRGIMDVIVTEEEDMIRNIVVMNTWEECMMSTEDTWKVERDTEQAKKLTNHFITW